MYFEKIVTEGNQPNFSDVAMRHTNALNNYLMYGLAGETDPAKFALIGEVLRRKLEKEKVVRHITTTQVVNNMTIVTTSILCCEGTPDY